MKVLLFPDNDHDSVSTTAYAVKSLSVCGWYKATRHQKPFSPTFTFAINPFSVPLSPFLLFFTPAFAMFVRQITFFLAIAVVAFGVAASAQGTGDGMNTLDLASARWLDISGCRKFIRGWSRRMRYHEPGHGRRRRCV
jgi:hypothetical protein